MKSASVARAARLSSPGAMGKTLSGVPAAAQTCSNPRSSGSKKVRSCRVWPNGGVPPTAKPVAVRASSGEALRASPAPHSAASFAASTRFAPDVSASTGDPSATNTSDFTICARSHPIARAASSAVLVPSGNRRDSTGTFSAPAASVNRSIAELTREPPRAPPWPWRRPRRRTGRRAAPAAPPPRRRAT